MTSVPTSGSIEEHSPSSLGSRPYLLLLPLLVPLCGVFTFIVDSSGRMPVEEPMDATDVIWLIMYTVAATTGAVILSHVPHHRVGLAQLLFGLLGGAAVAIYGLSALFADSGAMGAAAVFEGVVAAAITLGFLLLPASLLLFPTGELPSRRWRPLAWLMGLAAVLGGFASFVTRGFGGAPDEALFGPGPLDATFGEIAEALSGPYFVVLMVSLAGSAISLIVRYRRSEPDQRLQIKWVAAAGALLAVIAVVLGPGVVGGTSEVLLAIGLAAVPLAMAVAIVRYNLFDIDVVISRSLTFGVLAVFIGVVYVGIVVGLGELIGGGEGASLWLSVAATAVVAIGFQPVRVRVERWANRLVYGKRATPYEVLASFSHRATDESDEDVLARIPRLIVDGTGAVGAVVWVRLGAGFRAASVWPEVDVVRRLEGPVFEDGAADVSLPVFHDGELLGGISLVAARGGAITPPELELVESLADGLGLTLRNARLTAALRRQVKDLQRSRDRIVSAADAARRSLEHDLDSGPQQQLVAVKVKLGPIRKLAEGAGAVLTADLLADIEVQAGDAIQAVRDFAAGVYPPLLGAEGLSVALAQETRKAALPVGLEVEDVGRYPRDVESAVYFTILEALQNTAKYAEASHATVRLVARNGDLRFEVSDDGRGFDAATIGRGAGLSGIADRIDTIGGTWTITSTPGEGTVVAGVVPVSEAVPV